MQNPNSSPSNTPLKQPIMPVEPPKDPSAVSKASLAQIQALNAIAPPVQTLLAVGQAIVTNPAWLPHDGKTFCNFGVASAALRLKGYRGFYDAEMNPLLANDIIRVMAKDVKHWKKVVGSDAWNNALFGGLSIATYLNNPDGHVALVAPGPRVWSDKFQAYCPPVFNVGKTMQTTPPYTMGASFAFLYPPNYYVYLG